MAEKRGLPHIRLVDHPERSDFKTKSRGSEKAIPDRSREKHYSRLKKKLSKAWELSDSEQVAYHVDREGIYLEFKGEPGFELPIRSLEQQRAKNKKEWIRVLNVRSDDDGGKHPSEENDSQAPTTTIATVFVPHAKREHFFDVLEKYAHYESESGKPKNSDLINSISDIRKALEVESFWTDDSSKIPDETPEWCEVWLSGDSEETIDRFENLLDSADIPRRHGNIRFPERTVKLICASKDQLAYLSQHSDNIAEYRRAKETAAFWMDQSNAEQAEWVKELLRRTSVDSDSGVSVCILDTGINNGHPLLEPVLVDDNCQSYEQAWGTHDHDGHGTLMAGVVVYGDLRGVLERSGRIEIGHILESVKILPPPPGRHEQELWGHITARGVSLAEENAPQYKRVICMAISATDTRDRGRPSSWSAELDQISSGTEDDTRRLFVICSGNADVNLIKHYPDMQLTDTVHDPAQSWNALTVGAYTELDRITDPTMAGYSPVAPKGGLSPFSTTSLTWDNDWPIKPEIVLEGGNIAKDSTGFHSGCDDMSVLSTFHKHQSGQFYPFNMTSAATAQAAWMAAQLQAEYKDYWPETIRALMVHSAEWTDTLKNQFLESDSKAARKQLLRICGYGVPSLERALYSAKNSLTLIAQSELQPFDKKKKGSGYRTRDMHLYDLPWPIDKLQELPPESRVTMRVTLSYFIEPGPGRIGWKDRYRYQSHGLRFDVNSPTETREQFLRRINKAAADESGDGTESENTSGRWFLGPQARNKGSIHSDTWEGSAAELASANMISIVPVIGWWRERQHLGKWNRKTRYALIVSISTPGEEVDIYTSVAEKVGVPVSIETSS